MNISLLKEKVDDIFKIMTASIQEFEDLQDKENRLDQREVEIRNLEAKINAKGEDILKRENDLKRGNEILLEKRQEVSRSESIVERNKDKYLVNKEQNLLLDNKIRELEELSIRLEKKKVEIQNDRELLKSDRKALQVAENKLKKEKVEFEKLKVLRDTIQKTTFALKKEKNRLILQIDDLTPKLNKFQSEVLRFEGWEKDLKEREDVVKKSEALDIKRKRELNAWGRRLSRLQSGIIKQGHP